MLKLKYAKKNKIPIYTRAEVFADAVSLKKILLLQDHMVKLRQPLWYQKILSDQKLDPTIINGGANKFFKKQCKTWKR